MRISGPVAPHLPLALRPRWTDTWRMQRRNLDLERLRRDCRQLIERLWKRQVALRQPGTWPASFSRRSRISNSRMVFRLL